MVVISVFAPLDEAAETDEEHKEADSKEDRVEDGVDEGGLEDSRLQEVNCLRIIKLLDAILKPDNWHIRVSSVFEFCHPSCSGKQRVDSSVTSNL